jgi:PIN domain nuclease of toxin-antitoxin system
VTAFDASALLAFLGGDPGAETVESELVSGGAVGAANWGEVAQKIRGTGEDWTLARALLLSCDITVELGTLADAEWAASRWRRGEGLSLADRLCLALAHRLNDVVPTADRSWGEHAGIRQIR